MTTLYAYLLDRLGHAHRALMRALDGVSEADAFRGASENWRRYRYGTGLDGSIAGIVWHVAAWRHVAADGVEGGVFPDAEAVLPHDSGWTGRLAWLESGHARMVRALEELPPERLDEMVQWDEFRMPLHEVFSHMIEHDHYHAGHINLLLQQLCMMVP